MLHPIRSAVPAGLYTTRQVAPTTSGAHLTPVSDPQHAALAVADVEGRVYRGRRFPVAVLTALARKGHLVLTAHPGPRRSNWAYGEITPAGERELARLNAAEVERAGREQRATATAPAAAPVSVTGQADPFDLCRNRHTREADMIDAALAAA